MVRTVDRIAEELAHKIRTGDLPAGSRLPAHRALARSEGVALETASRVYRRLAEMGLIVGERGRGTFVREPPAPLTSPATSAGAVNLATNEPLASGQGQQLRQALKDLASSGAVEHLNVVQVTNLVQTMKDLKDHDVWMVGLDVGPNVPPLGKSDLNMALGLVLGSEGDGMRRLVRDTCDMLFALPMRGHVDSLNVATVGAVALYSAWQARNWQGWAHA